MLVVRIQNSRHFPRPSVRGRLLALATLLATSCCAGVDAHEEFDRTAAEIRGHVGTAETWTPDSRAETIQASVAQMFADGVLTVDEAVRVALLANPGLQASFFEVGISKADLVAAGRPQNPVAAISARFPEGGGLVNLTLSLSQSLIDLLLIPARTDAAKAHLEIARGRVVRSAVVLAGRVEREVLDLAALRLAHTTATDSLALAQRSSKLARARFKAGLGDQVDVALSNAAVLDARRELLVVDKEQAVGRAKLAALLGIGRLAQPWHVAGNPSFARLDHDGDTNALVRQALDRRLDVRIAQLLVQAITGERRVERRSVIHNLALGFEHERPETPPSLTGPSLQIELPLFSRNEPGVAREDFRLAAAKRSLAQRRLDTTREVREAVARAGAARALVSLFEDEILPAARTSVELSRHAWEAGERQVLVVLEAQRTLLAQRTKYTESLRMAARAQADLDVAMGGPVGAPQHGADR